MTTEPKPPENPPKANETALGGTSPDNPGGTPPVNPPETKGEGEPKPPPDPAANADDPANKGGEQKAKTVPESPEGYEISLPEGIEVDQAGLAEVKKFFHGIGLTGEQAQKLVAFEFERQKKLDEEADGAFTAMREGWVKEAKEDKTLGGENWDKTIELANQGMAHLAGKDLPKLKEALNLTGAGDHPAVIRVFRRVGELLGEGSFHAPGGEAPKPKGRAERMFGGK